LTIVDIHEGGKELPDTVVLHCDANARFHIVNRVIESCQRNGFLKFALDSSSPEKKGNQRPPIRIPPAMVVAVAQPPERAAGGNKPTVDDLPRLAGDNAQGKKPAGQESKPAIDIKGVDTLVITAFANHSGGFGPTGVGATRVRSFQELEDKVTAAFKDVNNPFEQVIIQADPKLKFGRIMRIVDMCARQKLPNGQKLGKLSFVEIPEPEDK
jgi:biopolymer transport protein ExbD